MRCARNEGILPALESSHAVAKAMELARGKPKDHAIVVCLSGRGDKDAAEIARLKEPNLATNPVAAIGRLGTIASEQRF